MSYDADSLFNAIRRLFIGVNEIQVIKTPGITKIRVVPKS